MPVASGECTAAPDTVQVGFRGGFNRRFPVLKRKTLLYRTVLNGIEEGYGYEE